MAEFRKIQKIGSTFMISIPLWMIPLLKIKRGDIMQLDIIGEALIMKRVDPMIFKNMLAAIKDSSENA